jgi:dipeptidyl aminopeptidase/acylaminoacyl peptidase
VKTKAQKAPCGSWRSPITADLIAAGTVGLGQIALDGEDLYWTEMRPKEGGRYAVVRWSPGASPVDVLPAPFNARTRVHEYGGGSFLVVDGILFFSNFTDQRLYRLEPGGAPRPITPQANLRYADPVYDASRELLYCVREDHTSSASEPANTLVALQAGGEDAGTVIVSGADFYAAARLSPDGSRLAWLSWSHPAMPWDAAELWVGQLSPDGTLRSVEQVAGGIGDSVFQPAWSPDSVLHFVSERTGWWNLYRWSDRQAEPLAPMEAEFGMPQWVFGMSTYGFESPGRIICSYASEGSWHLASLDTSAGRLVAVDTPYTSISSLHASSGSVYFIGGSPTEPASIVRLDLEKGKPDVLRRSTDLELDDGYLSTPEPIEYPTSGGQTAHAFYYPPKNGEYAAPAGERPPLLVISHGGPTGAASSTLSLSAQYWTSRGLAVVDVNYGGSTGYGRDYRERLQGRWGIVDVDDCTNAALYLVDRGEVDRDRLAIRGGSAGGYTTLCALAFRDAFKAGASYCGVSDLEGLAQDTHKFESRYLDGLVAPYPAQREVYVERSPLHASDRISCPVIFFQGLEDKVVPPVQAESMVQALRQKGLPVAYLAFEGEQHGFRRQENIKRTLEAELYFYSRVFGFELAEQIEPVRIDNLESE